MRISHSQRVAIAATLAVVIAGASLGTMAAAQDNRAMKGVRVRGIPVDGMSASELAQKLGVAARIAQERPIVMEVGDRQWSRTPSELGIMLDVEETVKRALAAGRRGPLQWFQHTFGMKEVNMAWAVSVHSGQLDMTIAALAKDVDLQAANGEVALQGAEVVATAPTLGVELRQVEAKRQLIAASAKAIRLVTLPVETSRPDIGQDQVERVQAEAKRLLTGDFTFKLPGSEETVVLPRQGLAAALGTRVETAVDGTQAELRLHLDPKALERELARVAPSLIAPAKDASFKVSGANVRVVPSSNGRTVDARAAADAIMAPQSGASGPIQLLSVEKPPALSTQQAEDLGIKERVSLFSTTFDARNAPRVKNIDLMADAIDGTLIVPGETFSLNGTTGPRTPDRGYQEAQIIVDGELVPGIGGGVCQVATTLFNAASRAGLDIRERSNHSLYISKYPLGLDATVNYGYQDLKFRNDTPYGILVKAAVTTKGIAVSIYSSSTGRVVETSSSDRRNPKPPPVKYIDDPSLPQGQEVVVEEGDPGFDITVTRKVIQGGEMIHSDQFISRYRAWKRIIRRGTGPQPSPSPSPAAEPTS
ncbi:MAG: VanW family protein [Actinobacteria bacterium]|nr:VanW family protein [Actinomycetota bacterium]